MLCHDLDGDDAYIVPESLVDFDVEITGELYDIGKKQSEV